MLRKILKRSFSAWEKNSTKHFQQAFDLLNTREYFKTIHNISKNVNLYNSHIEYLKDMESPEKASEYIQALNVSKDYQTAYSISQQWIKKTGIFGNRKQRKMFKNFKNYSAEKLGKKMSRSLILYNLVTCIAFLMLLYSEETLDVFFYVKDTVEEIIEKLEGHEQLGILFKNLEEKKEEKKIVKDLGKKVMFDDVIGIDEFKDELMQVVDYLKNPKKYEDMGAYVPKGILLVGKPGTGKTMLAQALANEAECSFIYKSGAEFDQIFVGSGSRNVRELFEKARKNAPSIIFIDEIDSVGGKRVQESNNTLNQLLVEIDGFRKDERIILVGATNLSDSLDPALKRPGRFDKTITIPLPDIKGREKLFEYYLKKIKVDEAIKSKDLAEMTSSFSGAMIKNMVNQAICTAILKRKSKADMEDFREVFDKEFMGIRKKKVNLDEKRKYRSAVYEAGMAVASLLVEDATPLYKVSILPKGNKVSGAVSKQKGDQLSQNKKQIKSIIAVSLSGRIAEKLNFNGEFSSRSADDYKKASRIALAFTRKLAMVEEACLISAEKKDLSDVFNRKLELESLKLLENISKETERLILKNRRMIVKVAKELVKRETLSREEVKKIIGLE